ncbi:hypothetical protein NE555_15320, partial [Alistipes onderdonkii]|nr:hypothetical protein [Alistipes onderdonkii]
RQFRPFRPGIGSEFNHIRDFKGYDHPFVIDGFTLLIPLIESIGAPAGSMHVFEVVVTDLAGQTTTQELRFQMPTKVSLEKTDLWANTASLTINNIDKNAQSVSLQYRIKGETEWNTAEVVSNSDGNYTATIKPTWTSGENEAGLSIYTANNKTG